MCLFNCSWQASLEQKRKDGLPPGVIFELLPVVAVLSQGPDSHLIGPGQGEQSGWNALGHDSESDPGPDLVGVVRAADKVEKACHGVGVGVQRAGDWS